MSLSADLTGKRALVTGASSGFGAHFARILAGAGADVVLAARRTAAIEAVAADIRMRGGSATTVALDVQNSGSIRMAITAAGAIEILINNAGITIARPALDQDERDWDHVVGTNLKGGFLVATEAARSMRGRGGGGSIINVASILGLRQASHVATYAISKAGMIQMTKQLALELARDGIRVNALAPGYFETDLNRDFFTSAAGEALIRRVPQRRLGQLADLDGPLLLLASDASRFMTGTVLAVDGGHLVSGL